MLPAQLPVRRNRPLNTMEDQPPPLFNRSYRPLIKSLTMIGKISPDTRLSIVRIHELAKFYQYFFKLRTENPLDLEKAATEFLFIFRR